MHFPRQTEVMVTSLRDTDTYELTLELRYSDGRTETQIARSSNSALGLRVASLIEQIGSIPSPKLREHMLKKFATVFSREYPEG